MFLSMKVLVKEEDLDIIEKSTPTNTETRLDTNAHRSWSWFIKLARML